MNLPNILKDSEHALLDPCLLQSKINFFKKEIIPEAYAFLLLFGFILYAKLS